MLFLKNVSGLDKKSSFFKAFSLKKGYILVLQVSVFNKRGSFFLRNYMNICERGIFLNLENNHMSPFCM